MRDEQQTQMDGLPILQFVNEIITAKRGEGIDEETRQYLREDMANRLLELIDRAIIEALPEEKATEFNDFLDTNPTDEQIQQFIVDAGVDTTKITALTMVQFKDLYLR